MPGFLAMKLCPELLLLPCNYHKYKLVSDVLREIASEYDSNFSTMGLDEVNMDVTDFLMENDMNNDEGR
jgi:DNA polymerase kappa